MITDPEDEQIEVLRQTVQDLSVQINTVIGEIAGLTKTQQHIRKRQLEGIMLRLQPTPQTTGNLGLPPTVITVTIPNQST